MGLAHYFTLLRIFISPLFPVFYLYYEWFNIPFIILPYILLTLLLICESSDLIDGAIARKRNQVTDLGKVLDPMADSITRISLFLTFTQGVVALPLLVVMVFFYRDLLVNALRTLCALRGVALAARVSGKIKAIIQSASLFLMVFLMIPYSLGVLPLTVFQHFSLVTTLVAAVYTALSAGDYLYANRMHIQRAFMCVQT